MNPFAGTKVHFFVCSPPEKAHCLGSNFVLEQPPVHDLFCSVLAVYHDFLPLVIMYLRKMSLNVKCKTLHSA